jgi:hypothetical protein
MVCIYRLSPRRERLRVVPPLLYWVTLGYLAELRGPGGSDEPG